MRHGKRGKTLGMATDHRVAVLRNMSISLIEHGRIETTVLRAKALRMFIEPLITCGKRKGDVAAIRLVMKRLPNEDAVKRLFNEISPACANRAGGYTRILKTNRRKGDNAQMAIIEFVDQAVKAD